MEITAELEKLGFIQAETDFDKASFIELLDRELFKTLADSKGKIRDMCFHLLNAGGKRVRPLLVLYSGLAIRSAASEYNICPARSTANFNDPLLTEGLVQASVAAELIHMASLVHDDIIDNSDMRRNRDSINKVWGRHFAVLGGDYLFAKAFGILSGSRLINSMGYMVEAIQNMCQGEIEQADNLFDCNISMENYNDRIAKKTAIFIDCCCRSGAAAVGGEESNIKTLGNFGYNLGMAYQIVDDILDFLGNPDVTGKPKSEDLRNGIITLPVILLLNHERYGEWLRDVIKKREMTEQVICKITEALKETGAIRKAYSIALAHIQEAVASLDSLPHSQYLGFLHEITSNLEKVPEAKAYLKIL